MNQGCEDGAGQDLRPSGQLTSGSTSHQHPDLHCPNHRSVFLVREHLNPSVTPPPLPYRNPLPPGGEKGRNLRTLTVSGKFAFDPHQTWGGRRPAKVRHSPLVWNVQESQENAVLRAASSHPPPPAASQPLALCPPHPAGYRMGRSIHQAPTARQFSSHWPHFTDKETESRGMLTPGIRGAWDQPQPKQEFPPGTNLHALRGPPSHLFGPGPLPPKPLWPPGRAPARPQLLPGSLQEAEPGETAHCTFLGTRPRRPICAPCLRLSFPIRKMGITKVVHLL